MLISKADIIPTKNVTKMVAGVPNFLGTKKKYMTNILIPVKIKT